MVLVPGMCIPEFMRVPAGQTTTRIRFVAITGSCGPTCGNLLDAFSFTRIGHR
ncbi:MAG: hypothetical protein IPO62_14700 [Saprospiraceae bacterium]|nr:hypothetical protein [Saprospiraceae bacterium]